MEMEVEIEGAKCAVLACAQRIEPGGEYYALGSGKVPTCVACAESRGWAAHPNRRALLKAWPSAK